MIISASRRTDIPAFFMDWFMNRLRTGYVLVRNPFNAHQISRVALAPDVVDGIVFWTKNPEPLLVHLDELEEKGFLFFVQVTVTGYPHSVEMCVPHWEDVVEKLERLSAIIGRKRIVWRYDPILLAGNFDLAFHENNFNTLASRLVSCAERCVISFVDPYRKSLKNLPLLKDCAPTEELKREVAARIAATAATLGLRVESCAEDLDLSAVGIAPGSCIDGRMMSELLGQTFNIKKDKNQRKPCGCVESIDIGAYNSCAHRCLYCYANDSESAMRRATESHDPQSPLLIGRLGPDDKVTERTMVSCVERKSLGGLFSSCL